MKQIRLLPVVVLLALSSLPVDTSLAQEAQRSNAIDEEAIRALEDQERLAVLNRDIESLMRIWSEQLMVNAPGNRVSPNRGVVLDLVRAGLIDYTSFERRIEVLRIDADIAIVMGAETIKPTGKAPQAGETVERRFTHLWKRDGETWRLMARHANIVLPE